MKHLAPLLIFLIIAMPIFTKAQNVTIEDFPVVDEGAFFIYDIEHEFNTSTIRIQGFTLVTYSWRYDVVRVTSSYVMLNVTWERYVNGTYSDKGGYTLITLLNESTMFFEVFYNVSCIYDAVEYAIKLYAGEEGEYSIENIIYEWNGVPLECVNASYKSYSWGAYGYFIISVKYGLVIEKVQYTVYGEMPRNETGNMTTMYRQPNAIRMVLEDTNMISGGGETGWLAENFYLVMIAVVIIVAVVVLSVFKRGFSR